MDMTHLEAAIAAAAAMVAADLEGSQWWQDHPW